MLALHYPDLKTLCQVLPRRSREAIKWRASRKALTKKKFNPWTTVEMSKLRHIYPIASRTELIAAFPRHPFTSITTTARINKIYKKKRVYKKSGIPALDQILTRSHKMGITLAELDEFAGTRNFFRHRRWENRKNVGGPFAAAAKALGGTISITWLEQ